MARMIQCGQCGQKYAWKPEMAGRPVRCKCGQRIDIPPEPHTRDTPADDQTYALAEEVHARHSGSGPLQQSVPALAGDTLGSQDKCPECKNPLEPGVLICLNCGFNLKTGRRLTSRPISTPAPPPPKPSANTLADATSMIGQPRPRQVERADINPDTRKVVMLIICCTLAIIGVIVGWLVFVREPAAPVVYLGDDKAITWELNSGSSSVEQFLSRGNNLVMIGGLNSSQALALDLKLRQMGAVDVRLTGAINGVMVRELIIQLPPDAAGRKALFDYQKEYYMTGPRKPDMDVGQKYIRLVLNL